MIHTGYSLVELTSGSEKKAYPLNESLFKVTLPNEVSGTESLWVPAGWSNGTYALVERYRDDSGAPTRFHTPNDGPPTYTDGRVVVTVSYAAPDLSTVKATLKDEIDAQAETIRQKYITPGSGQAMTYTEKARQAELCVADADPQAGTYPLLDASVGIEGDTLADVAALVLSTRTQWITVAAAIETIRLTAKQAIDDASTIADALLASDAANWTL